MKKLLILFFTVSFILVGCSSSSSTKKEQTIRLGVTGGDLEIWKHVQTELAKEDINLEIITFSDYTQPNIALNEKQIDINAFQHYLYFETFIKDHGLDLSVIGETYIAPLGIYSKKIKDVKELKEGDKVAIPNDVTNGSRSLILLQTAGLITLKKDVALPTVKDIVDNPLKLNITELDASQTARAMDDVVISCINNGVAVDAGLIPTRDAIFLEPVNDQSKPYINVIVTRTEDQDNPLYKRFVEVFQTDETAKLLDEIFEGSLIPVWTQK